MVASDRILTRCGNDLSAFRSHPCIVEPAVPQPRFLEEDAPSRLNDDRPRNHRAYLPTVQPLATLWGHKASQCPKSSKFGEKLPHSESPCRLEAPRESAPWPFQNQHLRSLSDCNSQHQYLRKQPILVQHPSFARN